MSAANNILLVTGTPGIGKTTVIRKVSEMLPGTGFGGFYTQEIRNERTRQGFELVTFQGDRFVMAHVESNSPYRVGKYGVNIGAIDQVVAMTIPADSKTELFLVDEIGKMECFSDLFISKMSLLLKSREITIATVALKGSGFISEVKKLPGAELWHVTRSNRDSMPDNIISWINKRVRRKS